MAEPNANLNLGESYRFPILTNVLSKCAMFSNQLQKRTLDLSLFLKNISLEFILLKRLKE